MRRDAHRLGGIAGRQFAVQLEDAELAADADVLLDVGHRHGVHPLRKILDELVGLHHDGTEFGARALPHQGSRLRRNAQPAAAEIADYPVRDLVVPQRGRLDDGAATLLHALV